MSRLLLFSGSQRSGAFNTRLLEHIAVVLAGHAELDILTPCDVDLPLFNQDLENEPEVAERVTALHSRFMRADGLILASPEYNCLPSPYLKNAIDWVSRLAYLHPNAQNPFRGKAVLLCSASTGWSGGAVGLTSLRALLAYLGALTVGEQICVPYAQQAWSGTAFNFDPLFEEYIQSVLDRFIGLASRQPSLEKP
jgi:chromate reductase